MQRIALHTVIYLAVGLISVGVAAEEPMTVNQISSVEVVEQSEGTAVAIMGSASPTFSVYRLENPPRLFLDFSNTEMNGDLTNWSVRDGLVDEVMILQFQDDRSLVTRVVVSLQNQEAEYDIDTEGNNVIATIIGDRVGAAVQEQRQYEAMVQAREAEIASLRQAADQAQQEAQQAQSAALNAEAERQSAALQALRLERERQALDAENHELRRRTAEAEARAQEVAAEYEQALQALQGYQQEVTNQRENLEALNRQTSYWQQEVGELRQELTNTRSDLQQRDDAIRAAMAREESLRQDLAGLSTSNSSDEEEIARLTGEQQELLRQLSDLRNEYQTLVGVASATNEALDQAESNLAEASDRRSSAEAQAVRNQTRMDEIQQYVDRLEAEVARSEGEAQAQSSRVAELESSIEELADREQQHRERAEQMADQLAVTQQELQDARQAETEMEQEITRLQARSRLLEGQLATLEEVGQQRDLLADEVAQNRQERQALQRELTEIQQQLEAANDQVAEAIRLRQEHERYVQQATEEHRQIEAQLETAQSARLEAEQAAQNARQEREQAERLLAQQRNELLRLDQGVASAIAQRDALNADLARLASDHLRQQEDLLQARQELAELQSTAAELAEEQARTRQELEAARAERQRTAQELERLEHQRDGVSSQLASAQTNLDQVLARQREAQDNLAQLEQTIARLQAERNEAQTSLADVAQQREQMTAEIRTMEQSLDAMRARRSSRSEEAATSTPPAATATLASYQDQPTSSEPDRASSSNEEQEPGRQSLPNQEAPIEITEVRFEQVNGIDRITVQFSQEGAGVRSLPWRDGRAGLLIEGATLPAALSRTLDTRAFAGPVQFVSSYTDDAGQVHLVAELSAAASEILSQEGRLTNWEFSQVSPEGSGARTSELEGYNSQTETTQPPPIRRPAAASYTIGERSTALRLPRLSRRLQVTIDLVNADMQNVLRLFSDEGDVNIIASGAVSGTITLRLRGVPLDQAFALILQSQGLGWEQHGNIIRVAPVEQFEEERRRALQRISEAFDVEPLQVRLRPVSYADGSAMLALLGDILSDRGSASFDDRTHTLILTDVAENLDAAEQLIDALDRQTPQVLIEARIVQTGESFSRGFGIQWGGDALFSPANGNATGLLFPSTIGIAGGAGQTPADGTATTPNFAVNVPAASAGSIGFQFGSLGQAVNLNLRLSAAEAAGSAKVISAPRILTLDGQSASISTGLSIPVQTVGAAGTNVTFIQANLSLTVTPTVTPDGFVHLMLNITKNEPDFGRTGANGDPSIITRTAQTQLLVRDGETSVIGGIFEQLSGSDETGVPILKDIPILGVLFHNYSFQDERNETLVFITPRIVNREVSLANYAPGEVLMTPPE
ncbi:MAG: type IV pilus secretin PilQ [Bradymonadales bacterium]|nr:type IV pilus secretin PilQ [Bradymonadales bacterium]